MRMNSLKAIIKTAARGAAVLLLGAGAACAQQTINLTAAPTTLALPDGSSVPMWGYFCGPAVNTATATCAAASSSAGAGWSPVVVTVPYAGPGTTSLTINLTNGLTFQPPTPVGGSAPAANNIPTSIVIVGQVGGGLGKGGVYTASPDHSMAQGNVTWPIANTGAQGTPPVQGPRVQSFGTEVEAGQGAASTVALTWSSLRPGTYLLESGTHPSIQVPMGLIGVLVVTQAPSGNTAGTAYPAGGTGSPVSYNAEVPLEFSEIDPAQNRAVDSAVRTTGFSETATYGPYAGSSISHISVTSGGTGYTTPPTVTIAGGGGKFATAVATIDTSSPSSPTYGQVTGITVTNSGTDYTVPVSILISGGGGSGATATAQLALGANEMAHCGEGVAAAAAACYPPAVNYTPLYYLINGVAFNKNMVTASSFNTSPASATGTILVRMVNAGLRMHVPSIVGSQTTGFNGTGATTTVNGFTLIAEDGNPVPGEPRVQTDVFMAAGKTFDVMVNVPPSGAPSLPVYDRELSLSGNASERDAGMVAYISVNGSGLPGGLANATAQANPDTYNSLVAGRPFSVSDPSKGVIANDINVYGVVLSTPAANGTVALNSNGTFTYTPNASSTATTDSFGYCANGAASGTAGLCATVSLGPVTIGAAPNANNITFTANTATYLKIPSPGVLSVASDPSGYPLTVATSTVTAVSSGLTLVPDANGGFTASAPGHGTYTFTYQAQNSQGTLSNTATVTLIFPASSNLAINVYDAKQYQAACGSTPTAPCAAAAGLQQITDYRWIIEEDKTFWIDPNCTANTGTGPATPGCPAIVPGGTVPTFGVNFHTSHMEFVAQGCTGPLSCEAGQTLQGTPTVCDVGNGACRPGTEQQIVLPGSVHLDPGKRYYISIMPGDGANPFDSGNTSANCTQANTDSLADPTCGHTMTGAPIPPACNILAPSGPTACTAASAFAPVNVLAQPGPLPPGKLSVIVFEDDFPLNGEQDPGGGVDVLSPNEPGLGGFNLVLWDAMGQPGDFTGQMTYDMFNQPLTNSLDGSVDPVTGLNACPITKAGQGITGMIVTCPKFESDGATLSPLAGQAVIANLMPGRFAVQAYPAADRIARGEEWIQTNTLDGQHALDAFIRIGEPSYFQEYGPAGYHDMIGFANPGIINARHDAVCAGVYGAVGTCNNTIQGQVVGERISRTPDQRLYPSGSRDAFAWTQCWVSLGDPDAEDFMFTKCDANGNFKFSNVPGGEWRLTIGDQWNDGIIDGLSTPANVSGGQTLDMGQIGTQQWQANLYTRTFIDDNRDGVSQSNELGVPFLNTTIRYRDGSLANNLLTDFNGVASFNETFPLFNWYTVEADTTRYKTTGIHTVYDAGGPSDGSSYCAGAASGTGNPACGTSNIGHLLANTIDAVPLPADLSVPGAVYCPDADCSNLTIQNALNSNGTPANPSGPGVSTGRIDPPWVESEGWQGFIGQFNFVEFGKAPYASCPPACVNITTTNGGIPGSGANGNAGAVTNQVGENGGIHGHVIYASTRPFDDPQLLVQTQWEPLVPHVTINLYQEGVAADGVTPTLSLVDTTQTSSWDDWAQGFYPNSTAGSGAGTGQKPYMSCPGQLPAPATSGGPGDFFFFSLNNQPDYLDTYNVQHNGGTAHTIPYNSQYKCYDGMHNWNQLQPAPYDGMYSFPSSIGIDPTSGKPLAAYGSTNSVKSSMAGTNCTICVADPDSTDNWRYGAPMLPPGKYVVEVVMPPGYEVVKEEDKNILIGDNFIAPVTQQIGGLGDVFILPDQASVASEYGNGASGYNANNPQNPTQNLGMAPTNQFVPGFLEPVWPCVGELRQVPDYISLFPQSQEVAPFAGAWRNLCDRKEVTLNDQMGAIAKFYIFTSTHIASKFTGVITDDFTSEFDPFAPTFGEKFAPANLPVSTKDYTGNEISRVWSDHFGIFDGLNYSTWEVNPPNPTGYSPTMMVQCMNDPGPTRDTNPNSPTFGQMIADPLFNPAYSDFCYENPYMPGTTDYLDTPVVPTEAFVGAGYNNPDCAYPDATPAIKSVTSSDIAGPWVKSAGHPITITALGDLSVPDYGYAGPSATSAPFNMKMVNRHFGFGPQGTVTVGGVPLTITHWDDSTITGTVNVVDPDNAKNILAYCPVQQQAQYGGSLARCGEVVITSGNGKQSVDTVTVTVGGKKPTMVSGSIQAAIDAAFPGDMLIVPPGSYNEMVLMWKPVRLQGVGAASSVINANAQPAGKLLDPWRRHINCLFGLTMQGVPIDASHPFDPAGTYSCPETGWNPQTWAQNVNNPQVDRLPLEAIVGWDATQNGNLAELLQEPSLMGAYEGAGVTVLAKGLDFHNQYPFSDGTETGGFPTVTTSLTGTYARPNDIPTGDSNPLCVDGTSGANRFPSNFNCNPSSIDGVAITNSSQGGGGIFVHGWAHNLQIANNRIYNNAGTLSGGISVGQGEFATPYIVGAGTTNAAPGSCSTGAGLVANQHEPYCFDLNVNVHHNAITDNSSYGDELFSATLAGGGGASFCTGSDYYKFNYNWVCGNMSSGEGGALAHLGFSFNGDVEHNTIVFNQATNPTIPTNGGGIVVMGTPDTDPTCGTQADQDCPPGLSDGTGPGLVINANLIQGNSADSGSGGGIRLQQVNGTEVSTFPGDPAKWYSVNITNNIISNNVAGWDGAGLSLQDSLVVNLMNNTIASNDSTASSGVLATSIGAPQSSAPAGNCVQNGPTGPSTASCPQPAGLVSVPNSSLLTTTFTGLTIKCPTYHYAPGTNPDNGTCTGTSYPELTSNVFWQNRSFQIGVGNFGGGNLNQQKIVTLYNAGFGGTGTGTATGSQSSTGACPSGSSYWDIGVRGDSGPGNHSSGFTLNPIYSVLTDATDYSGASAHNIGSNPGMVSQYCNGARVPPECTPGMGCVSSTGWQVPPGIADSLSPNPVFSLTPAATVDEGNNWINMSWGPLSMTNPAIQGSDGNWGGGAALGNYALNSGSPAIDYVPATIGHPTLDFYGNPRPDQNNPNHFDVGAVEFQGTIQNPSLTSISSPSGVRGQTLNITLAGTNLSGTTAINLSPTDNITVRQLTVVDANTVTATFYIAANAAPETVNVSVSTANNLTSNILTFAVDAPTLTSITPNTGERGTTITGVTFSGVGLTGTRAVGGLPGIGVQNLTVVNDTTVTANFVIAPFAGLGTLSNVTLTTQGGVTSPASFTVTGVQPLTFSASGLNTGGASTKTGNVTVSVPVASTAPLTLKVNPTLTRTSGTGTFSIVSGGTCVSGATINPGSSCTISVQYVPPASGSPTSNAYVTINGVGLGGTGVQNGYFAAN